MDFKKVSIFIFLLICSTNFAPHAIGRQSQMPAGDLKAFKELLATINASFTLPEGFNEVKAANNEKFPFHYGLQLPTNDFEIRFQVNSLKSDWKNYERDHNEGVNPDSLYSKQALAEVKSMVGEGRYYARPIPSRALQQYNADLGRSYFMSLADANETNHYQYALLVVLQKNHVGNIAVVCLSNERGPGFFQNINKLKDCLKFNN